MYEAAIILAIVFAIAAPKKPHTGTSKKFREAFVNKLIVEERKAYSGCPMAKTM